MRCAMGCLRMRKIKDSCLGGGSILPLPEIVAGDYHWGN